MPNPLGSLPASNSTQFSLNSVDWMKILRIFLVQLAGLVVSYGPVLLGHHYTLNGTDVTPEVFVIVNTVLEMARRFLSGQKAPTVPPPTPNPDPNVGIGQGPR